MNECGYLYIAAGHPNYLQEAVTSAASLRAVDPSAHITLITDQSLDSTLFDRIVIRPAAFTQLKAGFAYKTKHIYEDSPYERTLFLDTDTYFCEPARSLFGLLDYFDVCMAAAPGDMNEPVIDGRPLTACFPYNTGVIAFKKNQQTEILFKTWHKNYEKKLRGGSLREGESDQTSFMEASLKSATKVYVLPSIWNARVFTYVFLNGSVKIVHHRLRHKEDYEQLRNRLNEKTAPRCWDPQRKKCIYRKPKVIRRIMDRMRAMLLAYT